MEWARGNIKVKVRKHVEGNIHTTPTNTCPIACAMPYHGIGKLKAGLSQVMRHTDTITRVACRPVGSARVFHDTKKKEKEYK